MLRLKLDGRTTGKPKRRFMVTVREDITLVSVREEDTEDTDRRWQMIGCGKRRDFCCL